MQQLDADRALALLDKVGAEGPRRGIDRIGVLVSCLRFDEARRCAAEVVAGDRYDAGDALELARACLQAGDAGLATRVVRAALERAPDDVAVVSFDGTLHLWSGDVATAAERATRCLALSPGAPAALKLSGQVALLRGKLASALELLEEAASRDPDAETLVLVAEARRQMGRGPEAQEALGRAHGPDRVYSFTREANELLLLAPAPAAGPDLARRLRKPRFWGGRLDLHDALAAIGLPPASWIDHRSARASGRTMLETVDEALDRLSGNRSTVLTRKTSGGAFECVQPGPAVRAACTRLRSALASGGFDAAIAGHDALLEEHGHSPLVYTHRGELLLWCGRYAEAREDFEKALRLNRWTRWAWAGLGASHLMCGRPVLALATFLRGRRHALPAVTTPAYEGNAWHQLGMRRLARSAFRTARALQPKRASASLGLALTAASLGRTRAVAEHLADLDSIVPVFTRALLRDTLTTREQLGRDLRLARDVAARGFEMMRGNRSSVAVTWFDGTGRAYLEWTR
ncbi:MAG: tetratricopeptide repeat protein [Polyangiaceae bacterium]